MTRVPDAQVMRALIAGDGEAFYAAETASRKAANAPPFGRFAAIIVSDEDGHLAQETAKRIGAAAPHGEGFDVYGPAPRAPLGAAGGGTGTGCSCTRGADRTAGDHPELAESDRLESKYASERGRRSLQFRLKRRREPATRRDVGEFGWLALSRLFAGRSGCRRLPSRTPWGLRPVEVVDRLGPDLGCCDLCGLRAGLRLIERQWLRLAMLQQELGAAQAAAAREERVGRVGLRRDHVFQFRPGRAFRRCGAHTGHGLRGDGRRDDGVHHGCGQCRVQQAPRPVRARVAA